MLTYISNTDHYKDVLSRVQSVKHMLWIGTADIKDLYVELGKEKKPFLALIAQLIRRGVEVRLIHAKEPGQNFREDFDKYPILYDGMERVLCPRVHFKIIVIDQTACYVGSANLTGAGMGMKADLPDFKEQFRALAPGEELIVYTKNGDGFLLRNCPADLIRPRAMLIRKEFNALLVVKR